MKKYRHKATGKVYVIKNQARMHSAITAIDREAVVIYSQEGSNQLEVRMAKDFYDGRFEEINE